MNKATKEKIHRNATENYDGNYQIAAAAHVMGQVVIDYSAGQIPAGAPMDEINAVADEVRSAFPPSPKSAVNPVTKNAAPKKRTAPKKASS